MKWISENGVLNILFHSTLLSFQYRATDMVIKEPGKFELVFSPASGAEPTRTEVFNFPGGGCGMAMYNTDEVKKS